MRSFVALSLLFLSSCDSASDIVAQVGDYKITRKDAEYRQEVVRFYFPQEKRPGMGLEQLIRAYTSAQIIVNNGHSLDSKVVSTEEKRIDQSTLQPEKLNQIKAIFGEDTEAYRRVFVLPTLAERYIYYGLYAREPRFHEDRLRLAKEIQADAKKGNASFEELARKHGVYRSELTLSRTEGLKWKVPKEIADVPAGMQEPDIKDPSLKQKLKQKSETQATAEAERWIKDIVSPLKPGQISEQIINEEEYFRIVRMVRKVDRDAYQLETLSVKKADFNAWLEKERSKVVVKRLD